MADPTRALVLAGGGVTGIAWLLGVVAGLAEADVDVSHADLVVGTSAGAAAGAQITSGTPLGDLVARQLDPESKEIAAPLDVEVWRQTVADLVAGAPDANEARARVGRWALGVDTVPEAVRREVIEARLPVHEWPEQGLVIIVVDAESGEWQALDRASGVPLVDAVAASCAVPGVWPPVSFGGRRFVDGGVRSMTSADVAGDHDRVLVLVPVALADEQRAQLEAELATLAAETTTLVVEADEEAVAAFGPNPLDPAARAGAVKAGQRQAAGLVETVRAFWA